MNECIILKLKKMKNLNEFKSNLLGKEHLFNTMANQIFGGSTRSNGNTTNTAGDDCDTPTSDQDTKANTNLA